MFDKGVELLQYPIEILNNGKVITNIYLLYSCLYWADSGMEDL